VLLFSAPALRRDLQGDVPDTPRLRSRRPRRRWREADLFL